MLNVIIDVMIKRILFIALFVLSLVILPFEFMFYLFRWIITGIKFNDPVMGKLMNKIN